MRELKNLFLSFFAFLTLAGTASAQITITNVLAGAGDVDLILTAAGQAANTVKIAFQ